jgi:hypothetical protein
VAGVKEYYDQVGTGVVLPNGASLQTPQLAILYAQRPRHVPEPDTKRVATALMVSSMREHTSSRSRYTAQK